MLLIDSDGAHSIYSSCFGLFIEGSAEDQQLQAVAENVAASVLHSRTPSNSDLHSGDVSCCETIKYDSVQNNLIDVKCGHKAQVILFTDSPVFVLSSDLLQKQN